jgi:hypothetical protein
MKMLAPPKNTLGLRLLRPLVAPFCIDYLDAERMLPFLVRKAA